MFTGIIRELGRVRERQDAGGGMRFSVDAPRTAGVVGIGDSVSVNGCCLTAVEVQNGTVTFDAMPETLKRSALGRIQRGSGVNVEPAIRVGEPLGGHYVQGHVDGIGRVRSVAREGEDVRVQIEAPTEVLRYCVEKGSVTVDGVSLTVTELTDDTFEVALVPHTLSATTLAHLTRGDEVNLEADVLAKYVERLLSR